LVSEPDDNFKAKVVATILDTKPEKALSLLSRYFHVEELKLRVGVVKGHSKNVRAVYSTKRKEIFAARREYLYDPFTVLHEFYHHVRQFDNKHKGTEKHADLFAMDFIKAYNRCVSKIRRNL
jgi:hypothetical protein